MKKLTAVLAALCLLCAAFAATAQTAAEKEPMIGNGIKFGMTMDEVIALEGSAPRETDVEHTRGPVTFHELEYENVSDARLNNASVDRTYMFVDGKLVAVRIDIESKNIDIETVKKAFSKNADFAPLNAKALGNGIYAVDDDGIPEKNAVMLTQGDTAVVLETDEDGKDMDVTLLDLTADYLK